MDESESGFLDKIKSLIVKKPVRQDLSTEDMPSDADFERSLFEGGAMKFDLDKDIPDVGRHFMDRRRWYDEHPTWSQEWKTEGVVRLMEEGQFDLAWRQHFGGRIPERWKTWYSAKDDFEAAQNRGIQLSKDLVDAGISHPHHLVANSAGLSQSLNLNQLAMVMARPAMPQWNIDQIVESQRKMGVPESVIKAARDMAERTKSEREARSKKPRIAQTGSGEADKFSIIKRK